MADARLTAINPVDSSVVPVACNDRGELLLEEPLVSEGPPGQDGEPGPPGQDGEPGPPGQDGQDGDSWVPDPADATDGDVLTASGGTAVWQSIEGPPRYQYSAFCSAVQSFSGNNPPSYAFNGSLDNWLYVEPPGSSFPALLKFEFPMDVLINTLEIVQIASTGGYGSLNLETDTVNITQGLPETNLNNWQLMSRFAGTNVSAGDELVWINAHPGPEYRVIALAGIKINGEVLLDNQFFRQVVNFQIKHALSSTAGPARPK